MDFLKGILLIFNVIAALGVVGLVLVQHGKGADMGAAFGSGSAGGLFGARGAANFLSRSTAICAAVFFLTLIALTKLEQRDSSSLMAPRPFPAGSSAPASSSGTTPLPPPASETPKSKGSIPE